MAEKFGIPFGVVKTIADRLSPENEVIGDYKTFLTLAASNSASCFFSMMKILDEGRKG